MSHSWVVDIEKGKDIISVWDIQYKPALCYNSIFKIAVSCKVEVIHLPPQCIVTQGTAVNVITSDVSGTPDSRTL